MPPTTRQELEELFKFNARIKVVFTKQNGTRREMICTRNVTLIPVGKQAVRNGQGGQGNRPPSETSFPVFDMEKQDWRAFTIAKLISVEVLP